MLHKRLWVSAVIIALVILLGFILSVPHARELAVPALQKKSPASTPSVSLKDSYKKGVHTLSGSVVAPNACASLNTTASLSGNSSSTQSIVVALQMPSSSGICLEIPTTLNFSTTLAAPKDVPIVVTVNGTPASTTAP